MSSKRDVEAQRETQLLSCHVPEHQSSDLVISTSVTGTAINSHPLLCRKEVGRREDAGPLVGVFQAAAGR